jgi:uncharacterized membrane protein YkoI
VVWSTTANADLQGSERDRVATAATQAVGGGTVVDAESSDDRGEAYEVEVRTQDGGSVDVSLDKDLKVVGQDPEDRDDVNVVNDVDDRDDSVDGTDTDDRGDRNDAPDADDRALSAAERASAERAALGAVKGTVVQVEASDDRGGEAYEVEVRTSSDAEWNVELDGDFKVLRKTLDN